MLSACVFAPSGLAYVCAGGTTKLLDRLPQLAAKYENTWPGH
jgi:hypothetical protein